jgi:BirA family biotin operon repressor/biotin-[acetyl-CoA-carboxylase] ligase
MYKIGQPFIVLPKVDSTNNYAMKEAKSGNLSFGTVFFAIDQTHGKGQRSKTWESKPGENIMMSIYADPMGLNISNQVLFSFTTAIACYKLLKKYAGEETTIKWPNDIYWRDRKAGGILIENVIQGNDWVAAIIGIGININQTTFGNMERQPVSLKQITGKTLSPIDLAKELCDEVEFQLDKVRNHSSALLVQQYNDVLFKKGQIIKLKKNNVVFEALIKEVNKKGNLVVEQGFEREYVFGEIEWIG